MKASSQRFREAFLWSAAGATTAAMILAGSSAEAAHTAQHASPGQARTGPSQSGPGYPPPKGIYKPFTDCPLLRPVMQESVGGSATGCIAGDATTGSIKIGNITTQIKHPVTAQFGVWDPPNATPNQFTGGILPPPGGLPAQLVTSPEFVPGGLLKALGCPSSRPAVQKLCNEAQHRGGQFLRVHALAQSAGPITNFNLTTWTQPLRFELINPLLGSHCHIGSIDNPVVINPSLTGTLVVEPDPHPKNHPDTDVLKIKAATATDTTFTAPGVTGCGPGGSANIAIDEAIDASVGLPSASGANSLTLSGNFYFAVCFAPHNMASILLSAFKASEKASQVPAHRITFASLRGGRYGIR
jgi:hypothetical protein